jgi:hypothetical protein
VPPPASLHARRIGFKPDDVWAIGQEMRQAITTDRQRTREGRGNHELSDGRGARPRDGTDVTDVTDEYERPRPPRWHLCRLNWSPWSEAFDIDLFRGTAVLQEPRAGRRATLVQQRECLICNRTQLRTVAKW